MAARLKRSAAPAFAAEQKSLSVDGIRNGYGDIPSSVSAMKGVLWVLRKRGVKRAEAWIVDQAGERIKLVGGIKKADDPYDGRVRYQDWEDQKAIRDEEERLRFKQIRSKGLDKTLRELIAPAVWSRSLARRVYAKRRFTIWLRRGSLVHSKADTARPVAAILGCDIAAISQAKA
jgi:hypothetical protein